MVKGYRSPSPPFTTLHSPCLSRSDLLPLMPLRYLSEFLLGFFIANILGLAIRHRGNAYHHLVKGGEG